MANNCHFSRCMITSTQAVTMPKHRVSIQEILISPDQIKPETPLRLSVAAARAFPDGSMTASGLRREAVRGNLVIERIASKDYTTLANIERMSELWRVKAKAHDCGSGQHAGEAAELSAKRSGSSSTATSTSPQDALRIKLAKQKSAHRNRRKLALGPLGGCIHDVLARP
jgi:hypothetical protein